MCIDGPDMWIYVRVTLILSRPLAPCGGAACAAWGAAYGAAWGRHLCRLGDRLRRLWGPCLGHLARETLSGIKNTKQLDIETNLTGKKAAYETQSLNHRNCHPYLASSTWKRALRLQR